MCVGQVNRVPTAVVVVTGKRGRPVIGQSERKKKKKIKLRIRED